MGFDYTTLRPNGFSLPSDWNVVTVKDVARINEKSITKNFQIRTIEYIDIASVANGRIFEVQLLPLSKAPSRAKRIVRDNDILISTVRPNLKHFTFIKTAKSNTIASTGFAVISSYKVEPRYLYYYLTAEPFTNYLSQIADTHTSAYPAFNPDIIENAELLLPPFLEQQKIASILGALDDKIELNHEMNKTLEQMAQAIFKSWFVDFEFPNEDGGPYKSSGGAMVYNEELGKEIPKGWEVGTVGDLCKTQYGYTESASNEEIGPHFLRITDMNKEPWVDWSSVPYCKIDEKRFQKYKLNYGDVLISRMADPGKATIVEHGVEAVFASYLIRLKTNDIQTSYFLFYYLRSSDFVDYAYGTSDDTTRKSMNAKVISNCKLAIPPDVIINDFYRKIRDIRKQISINIEESSDLAQIRDTLLPKLLSGEIRVKDINIKMGESREVVA